MNKRVIIHNSYHAGLTFRKDFSHAQVGRGESDDGSLVQLAGDGSGQGQELGQLEELCVFFLPSGPGRVLGFLLHLVQPCDRRLIGSACTHKKIKIMPY